MLSVPFILWVLVLLFLLVAAAAIGVAYLSALKRRARFNSATPAQARIVKLGRSHNTGTFGGNDVDMTLEVIPPGAAPYQVALTWSVEPLAVSKLKQGDLLSVRIDATDPKRIYSGEKWAWAWEQIPPRYGNRVVFWYLVK